MPSINFKPEFAEAVKNGTKRQTIRQVRKNPIKPGDMLTMFTGQRTKDCRKLCIHKCKSVEEIEIEFVDFKTALTMAYVYIYATESRDYIIKVSLDGKCLKYSEVSALAEADGFDFVCDFAEFFNSHYGDNFKGVLIKW